MPQPADANRRPSWTILATIAGLSIAAVYCTTLTVYMIDAASGKAVADESLKLYREALAGTAEFPYQWRLLGFYLVFAGERVTGLHPHVVDVGINALLLFASATTLFRFSRLHTGDVGSLCVVALYLLATAVGFSDPYRIYFTNDYVMIACWFAAVYFVATERFWAAALLTFAGAWAKETMVLVPLLVLLRRRHGRADNLAVAMTIAAFLIPTVILRSVYRAPIDKWAWWQMLFLNVPLLNLSRRVLAIAVKGNLKAFMLYGALWIVGARAAFKAAKGSFARDLALTGVVYLVLAYAVVVVGEMRHFLPLAIVLLPPAIGEIERRAALSPAPR